MIVALQGGFGNQIFQLAYGLAMQARGRQVKYDRSRLIEGTHREYSLGAFNTPILFSGSEYPQTQELSLRYDESMLSIEIGTAIGYFQSEKYFDLISHIVRKELTFREPLNREYTVGIYQEIRSVPNSVALHVRRQDYVGLQQFHGLMPLEYYQEGLAYIRASYPDSRVFIFSDDTDWCRANLDGTVVRGTTKYEDMQLMSACQHSIMANSSFSWWATWLGDNKPNRIVVGPKKWFADPRMDSTDILTERWHAV